MTSRRLVLADQHPLVPFTVQGWQFACRAASFAGHWTGPVSLWLPGPELPDSALNLRFPEGIPAGFSIRFGPKPEMQIAGMRFRSKLPLRRWFRLQTSKLTKDGEPLLFYFRTLRVAAAFLPALKAARIPFVFEPHEIFYEAAREPEKMMKLEKEIYSAARHLFPISTALSAAIRAQLGISTPQTVAPLGHSGVNLSVPDYDPAASPRFLYIGSLLGWKGLDTAMAATAGSGIPFDIVGDAGGLKRYQSLCNEKGWSHVIFHGERPPEELPAFYHPGTICLLPLSGEKIATTYTSPLKLFEYLAAGRPVIVGNLPSIKELVQDRIHVRMAAPGDIGEWKSVVAELLASPEEASELARNARELGQTCTWNERARTLTETLKQLT